MKDIFSQHFSRYIIAYGSHPFEYREHFEPRTNFTVPPAIFSKIARLKYSKIMPTS